MNATTRVPVAPGAFRCAIVYHDTIGLRTDGAVLGSAIAAARPDAVIVHFCLQGRYRHDRTRPVTLPPELQQQLPLDCAFLLEHAYSNAPFLDGFARRLIYVPNIEWMDAGDEAVIDSGRIDTVLFKNAFSAAIFESLPIAAKVRRRVVTGWTSHDIGIGDDVAAALPLRAVHVRGVSVQKQSSAVAAAWLRDASFPPLDVIATLDDRFEVPVPLRAADNLHVHLRRLPEPELRALQRSAAIHVAPSDIEGFGHVLNEARAAGAILVTADAPPMNGLVEDGVSGILVSVDPAAARPVGRSQAFSVSVDALETAIRRALALSPGQRRSIGLQARRRFELERQSFFAAIADVLR